MLRFWSARTGSLWEPLNKGKSRQMRTQLLVSPQNHPQFPRFSLFYIFH